MPPPPGHNTEWLDKLAEAAKRLTERMDLLSKAEQSLAEMEQRRARAATSINVRELVTGRGPTKRQLGEIEESEMDVRRARGLAPPLQPRGGGPIPPTAGAYSQQVRGAQQELLAAKLAGPRQEPAFGLGAATGATGAANTDAERLAALRARMPIGGQAPTPIDMGRVQEEAKTAFPGTISIGRQPGTGTVEEMARREELRARMGIGGKAPVPVDMGRSEPAKTDRERRQAALDAALNRPKRCARSWLPGCARTSGRSLLLTRSSSRRACRKPVPARSCAASCARLRQMKWRIWAIPLR